MGNRDNPDDFVQIEVKQAVGKPFEEASAKISVSVQGPSLRVAPDERNERLDFFLEGQSEPVRWDS